MALRNLWRNRRRTLITSGSVAFGVWLAVLFVGTRQSTYQRLLDSSARMGFGTLTIATPGFLDREGAVDLPEAPKLTQQAQAVPGVKALRTRSLTSAMVATTTRNSAVQVIGIDPASESPGTSLYLAGLSEGSSLTLGDPSGCLVGALLAERLGLHVGSKLVYTTTGANGDLRDDGATVRGIFRTDSAELDGHVLVVPLTAPSLIAVYLEPSADADELQPRLEQALKIPGVEVYSWRDTQADLASYIAIDSAVYRLIVGFVAVIIAAGIFNTMMMNVTERRRELGIMLAVGQLPGSLFAMVLLEALLMGLGGLVFGVLLVTPFYLYLNLVGVDLSSWLGDSLNAGGVAIRLIINCQLPFASGVTIAVALVVMTVLAAVFPAAKAALTVPVKTVRM